MICFHIFGYKLKSRYERVYKYYKKPLYITMRTLLFFIPIGIITNDIYVYKFGTYDFSIKIADIASNFNLYNFIFCIVAFSLLAFIVLFIETYLIPELIYSTKKLNIDFNKYDSKINRNLLTRFGYNPYLKIKELDNNDIFIRYSLIKESMYLPMTLILWFVCINNAIGYIIASIIFLLTFFYGKVIIEIFRHYNLN